MRAASALALGVVCGFAVSLASCGAAPVPCGPSTCNGCCDENGECLSGSAVFECGSGGAMCVACQVNELCRSGVCGVFEGGEYDANFPGPRDASINFDAGLFDGGPLPIDAGPPDSGVADAGRPDAGRPDAGVSDAGRVDAGIADAGLSDAGISDAGPADAGPADAGRPDAGMTVDAGPPVSFATNIVPIFTMYCVSCHPDRATYSDARARVVPGSPLTSVIYQRITGIAGAPMPQGGQLSNDDPAATALIERWILQGAPNN
ncbi:MAG: hypothetical protein Q8S33_16765 [Myxococcales bacterium]|nr:hypothetical protein [Myxococcales bacterium]MDP3501992.1 hypothetical protein [Myxococcales bacterium]